MLQNAGRISLKHLIYLTRYFLVSVLRETARLVEGCLPLFLPWPALAAGYAGKESTIYLTELN